MGMVVWFNNPIWFITTMQYYFITLVILMSISDLIHILIYGVRFFFYTNFLYVIYYCSKFQLLKICQLVYSPLFFLISVTFYVIKWNYRITVICLFLLAVNKLNSIQFKERVEQLYVLVSGHGEDKLEG